MDRVVRVETTAFPKAALPTRDRLKVRYDLPILGIGCSGKSPRNDAVSSTPKDKDRDIVGIVRSLLLRQMSVTAGLHWAPPHALFECLVRSTPYSV
ncbi:unnamed protein product [Penicillium camemberti]|uniref:Str. FM013 n=1 Tax=Penicillium camemberti (strain FM 013) TaxID=1429867 RepID=A0A0G4PQA2_PENC3|nr:unnamed protein product [Penicillium camemberti]